MEQETRVRALPPESSNRLGWRKRQTRGTEVAVGTKGPLRVRLPPPVSRCAGVVQTADTPPSEGGPCEFESHLPYSSFRVGARVAQTVRGGSLKNCSLRVRVSPRACRKFGGVCKWTKRLDLQSSARAALRVRVPPPLPQDFHFGRSSKVRALRCERGGAGSSPAGQPNSETWGVSQARSKARGSQPRTRGFKSRTPCQTLRSGGREARHWIVYPDHASSSLVRSAFQKRRKLKRHGHPTLNRGAAGSSPARRISS